MTLESMINFGGLDPWEVVLRLCLAVLFGLAIGFDREMRNKPAGLRTHAMISLAACSFTVIALALVGEVASGADDDVGRADPIRALEAVATGVAFLGAGAIIQSRGNVHGITTGSGMWLAGAIGLACGGGFYFLAILATVLGIVLLTVLGLLQKHVLEKDEDGPRPSERANQASRAKRAR